jgi:hypothetical protein
MPAFAKAYRGVPLGISRIYPECLDSDPSDRSVAANVLFRQEPNEEEEDEEEDEDEGDGKETAKKMTRMMTMTTATRSDHRVSPVGFSFALR